MRMKIDGLGELSRKLEKLESNARALHGTHKVPAADLFTADFMRHHSQFESFDQMLAASGFPVESLEDFAAIPDDEWDVFVRSSTTFTSWQAMQEAAGKEWVASQLGLS